MDEGDRINTTGNKRFAERLADVITIISFALVGFLANNLHYAAGESNTNCGE